MNLNYKHSMSIVMLVGIVIGHSVVRTHEATLPNVSYNGFHLSTLQ